MFKSQIDDLAKESGELRAASLKAGVGFEEFQKTSYVTGLSTEQLTMLFRKMQQNIASASGAAGAAAGDFDDLDGGLGRIAGGSKQAGEAFKKLGIDLKGKDNAQIFQETAQAIAKIQSPAERTALAMRLFGRSGQDLLPFLNKSPAEIAALADQFDTFGGITNADAAKLKAYTLENKRFNLAMRSLKIAILTEVVPAFTWLITKGNEVATWFKKNVDTSQLLNSSIGVVAGAFLLLGGAAATSALATITAWLAAAFPFIALILLVDDLVHAIKGDANTATEAFLKDIFGAERGESIFQTLRRDVGGFIDELSIAEGWLGKIKKLLEIIAAPFRAVLSSAGLITRPEDVQVAELGVTRKARQKARRAVDEETLGASLPEGYGGVRASVAPPSASFAPTPPGSSAKKVEQTNHVSHVTNVTQNIEAPDPKSAADQSVEGIKGVQSDEKRATVADLETWKLYTP